MTWLVRRWTLRYTSDDAGFSMIEMVVALLVLALVTTASLVFFINNLRSVNGQSQRQQAVYLADQQLETVQSLPVASMVAGRTSAAVTSLFGSTAATRLKISSQDDTTSASDYDPTATASSTPTVPTSFTQTVNGVPYTIATFIDTCWYTLSTGLCGPTSGSATTQEDRVSVDVAWQSNGQCLNGCDYSTSTIIDPSGNPQFNSNISTPSWGNIAVGPVNYTAPAVPQIINDIGGTCTTNGNTFTGHTKVVITDATGLKSGVRVWMSTGGGDIPTGSVYQPSASEVDFCLQTADVPGGYTISVINPDGGHFQISITEIPSIGSASAWTATTQNLTLTGSGFESGVTFAATNGASWTGTSNLVTGNTTADSVKLLGFVGPKDGGTTTITATNTDAAASNASITITAPKVTAVSPTFVLVGSSDNIILTGANFPSGLTAVLTSGSGTATVTAVGSSTSATLKVQPTTAGTDTVYVYDPDGGYTSTFTVAVHALPAVTSTSPSELTKNALTTVTVTGTGFVNGITATAVSGGTVSSTVTWNSATSITLSSAKATSTSPLIITLTNPDTGQVSVTLNVPTITNLVSNPNPPVHSSATQQWIVTGTGFESGATVSIKEGGTALTVSGTPTITSTQITFVAAPTSASGSNQTFVVTVTNLDGSTVTSSNFTLKPS